MTYRDALTLTVWLDARTDRVIDLTWTERITVVAGTASNNATLSTPLADRTLALPRGDTAAAVAAARRDHDRLDLRSALRTAAGWCAGLAVVALLVALGFRIAGRRREPDVVPERRPTGSLVSS